MKEQQDLEKQRLDEEGQERERERENKKLETQDGDRIRALELEAKKKELQMQMQAEEKEAQRRLELAMRELELQGTNSDSGSSGSNSVAKLPKLFQHLSALRTGKALDVCSRLSETVAVDYKQLKEALLKRYEMTENGFRMRLGGGKPEDGESPEQFVTRLNR